MSFAFPAFLAALALLIPVVIAFLVRRQRRVIRVPSTMVWRLGARSVAKSRRIRDIRRLLALLVCLGGVAALVVAAARPSGTRTDTTVYVVDISASMAGAPIDEARTWLGREVASLGPEARVAIIVAGAEARVVLPPSPPGPRVDEAIRGLAAEKDVAAIDEAVTLADGLARAGRARVVVLSDQAIDADVSRIGWKPSLRVFSRKNGAATDNIGITSLFTRTAPDAHDDEEREASITVATSSITSRRAHLVVTLGGRPVTDRRLEVPEHGEVNERVVVRGGGRLVARIESDDGKPDALALDDEASLEEIARRPPRVALVRVKDDGVAAHFIAKALRAAGVTELIDVDADGAPPAHAEVAVVLHDGSGRPGGVPAFLVGVEPEGTGITARPVGKAETHLRSIASEDPLLRGVGLDEVTILKAKVATPPRGARALVDLDSGPTLMAGGSGEHSWVWLGIDPDASDLVLRVAFPVLVSNVLAHLGGSSQVVTAKTVPRAEVMLASSDVSNPLAVAPEPRWRMPAGPSMLIAMVGALLLTLEAWLTFRRRWAA